MIDAHEARPKRSGRANPVLLRLRLRSRSSSASGSARRPRRQSWAGAVPRVKGRVRAIRGRAVGRHRGQRRGHMEAIQKDPSIMAIMMSPFGLTPGFEGPAQPPGEEPEDGPGRRSRSRPS